MAYLVFALAAACGAAAAQPPEAQAVLQAAADSMQSVRTATYDGRLELRSGTSWRLVTAQVQMARISSGDASDPVGGRIAVRGEITGSSSPEPKPFQAAYDGTWMRRLEAETGAVLRGHPGFGGEALLRGSFGDVILNEYLAAEPFADERAASGLRLGGRAEVDGIPCDVVEARLGDAGRRVEWAFGVEDHLPRQMRRWYRSARGGEVELTLTVSNLQINFEIAEAAFKIPVPEGFRVETVGKRPPQQINFGDPCPEWEVTGSDGKIHTLSDYEGRLVVLEFWSSSCGFCKRSMPALQRMHDTYGGRGVAVLAFNIREHGAFDPVAFVRNQGYSYFVADGNPAAIDYSVRTIPAFFVIDGQGRLLHRATGYNEARERQLTEVIERYLDEHGR